MLPSRARPRNTAGPPLTAVGKRFKNASYAGRASSGDWRSAHSSCDQLSTSSGSCSTRACSFFVVSFRFCTTWGFSGITSGPASGLDAPAAPTGVSGFALWAPPTAAVVAWDADILHRQAPSRVSPR